MPSADDASSLKVVPRVVGRQASEILQRHSGVAMASVIVSSNASSADDDRPARPRLSGPAARAIAERHSGAAVGRVLDHDANRDYETPRSRPRVRDYEAENVARSGSGLAMSAALNHEANRDYYSAPDPRVKGPSGEDILQRGIFGTVGDVIQVDLNVGYASPRPIQRVNGEPAVTNAEKGRGLHIAKVLDSKANADYSSPRPNQPRVRNGQGLEIATRGINGTMSKVMKQQTRSYDDYECDDSHSPRPEPRIRPEARDIASAHQQGTFGQVLKGRIPASPVPAARVTEKAMDNYDRGNRGTLGALMTDYGKLQLSDRPASRVKYEGNRIAEYGQTGNVKDLFNQYGNLPRSARPEPRVRPEAKAIAVRNMGTMSELMVDS